MMKILYKESKLLCHCVLHEGELCENVGIASIDAVVTMYVVYKLEAFHYFGVCPCKFSNIHIRGKSLCAGYDSVVSEVRTTYYSARACANRCYVVSIDVHIYVYIIYKCRYVCDQKKKEVFE